ncbi:2019_t:CDS:1 [Ambispora gerdemannii]|uniref:2019_t:CDS:1 n=1 Tax=Ambispora gerdemannii TaxID=144530 RepID=A0A9N9GWM7_9GLOM|nr:2019_t:CDS:1 [Ambispora gerdemannii]
MDSNSESIIKATQTYFNDDFVFKITLDALAEWLPTQNIQTTSEKLKSVLSERADLFELIKGYNSQVMVQLKKGEQYCGSSESVVSMINSINGLNYRNFSYGSNISEISDLSEDEAFSATSTAKINESITNSSITTFRDDGGKINGGGNSVVSIETVNKGSRSNSSPKSPISKIDMNIIKTARKYLENYQVDSVFELERYLKTQGFQFESEKNKAASNSNRERTLKKFLTEYRGVFQVFNSRGVTSVKLVKANTTGVHNSKLSSRMKLTENLVKEYVLKNSTPKGLSIKELIIHLRGYQETITDELAEFLKSCSRTFECDMYEDMCYVRVLPHVKSLAQKVAFGKFRGSKAFTLVLIRECVLKLGIATYSEIEKQVRGHLSNQQVNVFACLQQHKEEFLFKNFDTEPFIRLKPTDQNFICHIRRYIMEFGRVKFSQLHEYLKRMDMLPKITLEKFLDQCPEYVIRTESGIQWVRSHDIEIVRSCRNFLRDKQQIRMSVVGDYLKRSDANLRTKLLDLLEDFPEFQFAQGTNDIFVEFKPFPTEKSPTDYVRKLINVEGGRVPLSVVTTHLNWTGAFPEFKIVELLKNSSDFLLENKDGKSSDVYVTLNPRKFKTMIGNKVIDEETSRKFSELFADKSEKSTTQVIEPTKAIITTTTINTTAAANGEGKKIIESNRVNLFTKY